MDGYGGGNYGNRRPKKPGLKKKINMNTSEKAKLLFYHLPRHEQQKISVPNIEEAFGSGLLHTIGLDNLWRNIIKNTNHSSMRDYFTYVVVNNNPPSFDISNVTVRINPQGGASSRRTHTGEQQPWLQDDDPRKHSHKTTKHGSYGDRQSDNNQGKKFGSNYSSGPDSSCGDRQSDYQAKFIGNTGGRLQPGYGININEGGTGILEKKFKIDQNDSAPGGYPGGSRSTGGATGNYSGISSKEPQVLGGYHGGNEGRNPGNRAHMGRGQRTKMMSERLQKERKPTRPVYEHPYRRMGSHESAKDVQNENWDDGDASLIGDDVSDVSDNWGTNASDNWGYNEASGYSKPEDFQDSDGSGNSGMLSSRKFPSQEFEIKCTDDIISDSSEKEPLTKFPSQEFELESSNGSAVKEQYPSSGVSNRDTYYRPPTPVDNVDEYLPPVPSQLSEQGGCMQLYGGIPITSNVDGNLISGSNDNVTSIVGSNQSTYLPPPIEDNMPVVSNSNYFPPPPIPEDTTQMSSHQYVDNMKQNLGKIHGYCSRGQTERQQESSATTLATENESVDRPTQEIERSTGIEQPSDQQNVTENLTMSKVGIGFCKRDYYVPPPPPTDDDGNEQMTELPTPGFHKSLRTSVQEKFVQDHEKYQEYPCRDVRQGNSSNDYPNVKDKLSNVTENVIHFSQMAGCHRVHTKPSESDLNICPPAAQNTIAGGVTKINENFNPSQIHSLQSVESYILSGTYANNQNKQEMSHNPGQSSHVIDNDNVNPGQSPHVIHNTNVNQLQSLHVIDNDNLNQGQSSHIIDNGNMNPAIPLSTAWSTVDSGYGYEASSAVADIQQLVNEGQPRVSYHRQMNPPVAPGSYQQQPQLNQHIMTTNRGTTSINNMPGVFMQGKQSHQDQFMLQNHENKGRRQPLSNPQGQYIVQSRVQNHPEYAIKSQNQSVSNQQIMAMNRGDTAIKMQQDHLFIQNQNQLLNQTHSVPSQVTGNVDPASFTGNQRDSAEVVPCSLSQRPPRALIGRSVQEPSAANQMRMVIEIGNENMISQTQLNEPEENPLNPTQTQQYAFNDNPGTVGNWDQQSESETGRKIVSNNRGNNWGMPQDDITANQLGTGKWGNEGSSNDTGTGNWGNPDDCDDDTSSVNRGTDNWGKPGDEMAISNNTGTDNWHDKTNSWGTPHDDFRSQNTGTETWGKPRNDITTKKTGAENWGKPDDDITTKMPKITNWEQQQAMQKSAQKPSMYSKNSANAPVANISNIDFTKPPPNLSIIPPPSTNRGNSPMHAELLKHPANVGDSSGKSTPDSIRGNVPLRNPPPPNKSPVKVDLAQHLPPVMVDLTKPPPSPLKVDLSALPQGGNSPVPLEINRIDLTKPPPNFNVHDYGTKTPSGGQDRKVSSPGKLPIKIDLTKPPPPLSISLNVHQGNSVNQNVNQSYKNVNQPNVNIGQQNMNSRSNIQANLASNVIRNIQQQLNAISGNTKGTLPISQTGNIQGTFPISQAGVLSKAGVGRGQMAWNELNKKQMAIGGRKIQGGNSSSGASSLDNSGAGTTVSVDQWLDRECEFKSKSTPKKSSKQSKTNDNKGVYDPVTGVTVYSKSDDDVTNDVRKSKTPVAGKHVHFDAAGEDGKENQETPHAKNIDYLLNISCEFKQSKSPGEKIAKGPGSYPSDRQTNRNPGSYSGDKGRGPGSYPGDKMARGPGSYPVEGTKDSPSINDQIRILKRQSQSTDSTMSTRPKRGPPPKLVWRKVESCNIGQFFVNKVYLDAEKIRTWEPPHLEGTHTKVFTFEDVIEFADLQRAVVVNSKWVFDAMDYLVRFPKSADLTVICPQTSVGYDHTAPAVHRELKICEEHQDSIVVGPKDEVCNTSCHLADCSGVNTIKLIHPYSNCNINANFLLLRYSSKLRILIYNGPLNKANWEKVNQLGWFCDFPINTLEQDDKDGDKPPHLLHSAGYRFSQDLQILLDEMRYRDEHGRTALFADVNFENLSPFVQLIIAAPNRGIQESECQYGLPQLCRLRDRIVWQRNIRFQYFCQTCKMGTGDGMHLLKNLFRFNKRINQRPGIENLNIMFPSKTFIQSCKENSEVLTEEELKEMFSNNDRHCVSEGYLHDIQEPVVRHTNLLLMYQDILFKESPSKPKPAKKNPAQIVDDSNVKEPSDKSESISSESNSVSQDTEAQEPNSGSEIKDKDPESTESTTKDDKKSDEVSYNADSKTADSKDDELIQEKVSTDKEPKSEQACKDEQISEESSSKDEEAKVEQNSKDTEPKSERVSKESSEKASTEGKAEEIPEPSLDSEANEPTSGEVETPDSHAVTDAELSRSIECIKVSEPEWRKFGFLFTGSQTVGFGSWGGQKNYMCNFSRYELGVGLFPYIDEHNVQHAFDLSKTGLHIDVTSQTLLVPYSNRQKPYSPIMSWVLPHKMFFRCVALVRREIRNINVKFADGFHENHPFIQYTDCDPFPKDIHGVSGPVNQSFQSVYIGSRTRNMPLQVGNVVELICYLGDKGLKSDISDVIHTFKDKQAAANHYGLEEEYRQYQEARNFERGRGDENWGDEDIPESWFDERPKLKLQKRKVETFEEKMTKMGLDTDEAIDDHLKENYYKFKISSFYKDLMPEIDESAPRIECRVTSIPTDMQWLESNVFERCYNKIPRRLTGPYNIDLLQQQVEGQRMNCVTGINWKFT